MIDFEQSLGKLRPISRIQRDQILFQAGLQQARSQSSLRANRSTHGYWPAIAAGLALAAVLPWVLPARRQSAEIKVVYLYQPQTQPNLPANEDETSQVQRTASDPMDFIRMGASAKEQLSWRLIRDGLDALPATPLTALDPVETPLSRVQTLELNIHKRSNPRDAL